MGSRTLCRAPAKRKGVEVALTGSSPLNQHTHINLQCAYTLSCGRWQGDAGPPLRSPHAPVWCASFYRLEKKKLAETREALQISKNKFAITAHNLPSSCAQGFDQHIDVYLGFDKELDDTLKDQAKLEENLEKFVVSVAPNEAHLFVIAGIGKHALSPWAYIDIYIRIYMYVCMYIYIYIYIYAV